MKSMKRFRKRFRLNKSRPRKFNTVKRQLVDKVIMIINARIVKRQSMQIKLLGIREVNHKQNIIDSNIKLFLFVLEIWKDYYIEV